MKFEECEYIRYRLAQAHESLQEATLLLEHSYLRGTVNRLYYACFYVVSALLFTEGLHSNKHSGIRSLFNLHWIKTGRLSEEAGRLYQQLFKLRQEGDYEPGAAFERTNVELLLRQTQSFVSEIEPQILRRMEQ